MIEVQPVMPDLAAEAARSHAINVQRQLVMLADELDRENNPAAPDEILSELCNQSDISVWEFRQCSASMKSAPLLDAMKEIMSINGDLRQLRKLFPKLRTNVVTAARASISYRCRALAETIERSIHD